MRALTIPGVILLGACQSVGWLGDWCLGEECEAFALHGDGGDPDAGRPPTRDEVCAHNLWGCQWKEPTQQAFFKPPSVGQSHFGQSVALDREGLTLVIGAPRESEGGSGINPGFPNGLKSLSGAAVIFRRQGNTWVREAYLKASNSQPWAYFGTSVSISADGNLVAVGAPGIDENEFDASSLRAGAVYLFERQGSTWVQRAYLRASNANAEDQFGLAVALAADGKTLAVGAPDEASSARAINGNQLDNSSPHSGAVYLFDRRSSGVWEMATYVKPSNTDALDAFGACLSLSDDGRTLAVGAPGEDGVALGINGDANTNTLQDRGAVYVFERSGSTWAQSAYVKPGPQGGTDFGSAVSLSGAGTFLAVGAPKDGLRYPADPMLMRAGEVALFERRSTGWSVAQVLRAAVFEQYDRFGTAVSFASDGRTLAIGAPTEDGAGYGPNSDPHNNHAYEAGAAYVFVRNPGGWTQMTYLKASNTRAQSAFGNALSLSGDAANLAIGCFLESTESTGINAAQGPDTSREVGAAYLWRP